jgi:hypothetical protein
MDLPVCTVEYSIYYRTVLRLPVKGFQSGTVPDKLRSLQPQAMKECDINFQQPGGSKANCPD